MADKFPPVGFQFKVTFNKEMVNGNIDTGFQSVSGLAVEKNTETLKEGGRNNFEHVLPLRTSYSNVTLKRGLIKDSALIEWCKQNFNDLKVNPADLNISLLNDEHEPLMTWKLKHAIPLKWEVSDFNAEESAIVVETIELAYQYFEIE